MNDLSFRKVNRIQKQEKFNRKKIEKRKQKQRRMEEMERDGILKKREEEAE